MATNKIVYGNTVLIDVSNDTATESDVVSGKTFHDRSGVQKTGTASGVINPDLVFQDSINNSNTMTYTYDATKSYVIIGYVRVASAQTRAVTWKLIKGTLTRLSESSFTNNPSLSNNTTYHRLTMKASSSTQQSEFDIFQLD